MKTLVTLLLICSLATAPAITLPPLTDANCTTYDISAYAITNPALRDLHGLPYTRQVVFALEGSTNVYGPWQPICTVTNWCNNQHALIACYTNGTLAAAKYGPVGTLPGPQWLDKCIVGMVIIGVGIYICVQLKKICDHCLPPQSPPSTPPQTNSVAVELPPQVVGVNQYFVRIGTP